MSFLDKARELLGGARDKVDDLADEHGDKMKEGVEKAGNFVDEKTGGKYSEQIDSVQQKADDAITQMDDTPDPGAAAEDAANEGGAAGEDPQAQ